MTQCCVRLTDEARCYCAYCASLDLSCNLRIILLLAWPVLQTCIPPLERDAGVDTDNNKRTWDNCSCHQSLMFPQTTSLLRVVSLDLPHLPRGPQARRQAPVAHTEIKARKIILPLLFLRTTHKCEDIHAGSFQCPLRGATEAR